VPGPQRWFGALLWLCGACFSEGFAGGPQTGGTAGTAGTAGETAGCVPGAETCPCLEGGRCDAGLVCASQLCVDLGGLSNAGAESDTDQGGGTAKTTDDGAGELTSASASGTGETGNFGEPGSCEGHCGEQVPHFDGVCSCDPGCAYFGDCCDDYETACGGGGCVFNEDCAPEQVCSFTASVCVDAFTASYDIVVDQWQDKTDIWWDGIDDVYADVYYDIYYGGELVFTSETMPDVFNASWTVPWSATLDVDSVLAVAFSDDDTDVDEFIDIDCFPDQDEACGPVPVSVLHAGTMVWDSADFLVQVRFLAQ
jgi:Somatomedin B domain